MASSASGEQSLSLSSTSGRTTTRFSVGSLDGDDAMALPLLITADAGDRLAIADGDTVEASEDATSSLIIVDAVMKSLSSSLAAPHAMGGNGLFGVEGKVEIPTTCHCRSTRSGYC